MSTQVFFCSKDSPLNNICVELCAFYSSSLSSHEWKKIASVKKKKGDQENKSYQLKSIYYIDAVLSYIQFYLALEKEKSRHDIYQILSQSLTLISYVLCPLVFSIFPPPPGRRRLSSDISIFFQVVALYC